MTPRGEAVAAEGEIAAGDLRGPEVAGRSGSGFQRIAAEQRLHAGTGGRADVQPIGHGSHGLVPGRSVGRGVREKSGETGGGEDQATERTAGQALQAAEVRDGMAHGMKWRIPAGEMAEPFPQRRGVFFAYLAASMPSVRAAPRPSLTRPRRGEKPLHSRGAFPPCIASHFHPAGHVHRAGPHGLYGRPHVLGVQAAREDDVQRGMPPHALLGEREIAERAGAAVGRAGRGVEQEVRGGKSPRQRDGRRSLQPERFHKRPAQTGELRAIRRIFVAVKLHEIELGPRREMAGLVEWEIHDHRDAGDKGRQRAQPVRRFLEFDDALRAGKEIEAERIGTEVDGGGGIRAVREPANFHPHTRTHSMTFPCTCLICPWWVRT